MTFLHKLLLWSVKFSFESVPIPNSFLNYSFVSALSICGVLCTCTYVNQHVLLADH